jgi:hypothetical protein
VVPKLFVLDPDSTGSVKDPDQNFKKRVFSSRHWVLGRLLVYKKNVLCLSHTFKGIVSRDYEGVMTILLHS